MKLIVIMTCGLAAAGCVAPQDIVVNKFAYASYSCPQLEQELIKLGAIKSKAANDQSMTTGTQVAAAIVGSVATLGAGSVINYANLKNAENNERKAKAQLDNIYSIWDQKNVPNGYTGVTAAGADTLQSFRAHCERGWAPARLLAAQSTGPYRRLRELRRR